MSCIVLGRGCTIDVSTFLWVVIGILCLKASDFRSRSGCWDWMAIISAWSSIGISTMLVFLLSLLIMLSAWWLRSASTGVLTTQEFSEKQKSKLAFLWIIGSTIGIRERIERRRILNTITATQNLRYRMNNTDYTGCWLGIKSKITDYSSSEFETKKFEWILRWTSREWLNIWNILSLI